MPGDFGFGGMLPDQSSGLFDQDAQMRDKLAQIMQAQQGQPPQGVAEMPPQMPGGGPQMPPQMPGGGPQMPGAVPEPQSLPPGAGQPPFPASPDPRYTPEVEKRMQQFIAEPPGARRQPRTDEENRALEQLLQQEQRRSQFGLPGKTAQAKPFDEDWEGLDIVGGANPAPGLRRS